MIDFKNISGEELKKLEEERKKYIPPMIYESTSNNPIINELRFNYGYVAIHPFLINGQTGDKFELKVHENNHRIHLAFIGTTENKKGRGTKMMELLTSLCDKYQYDIDLEVDAKFGVNKRTLMKFYKGFGFNKIPDRIDSYFRSFLSK